MIWLLPVAILAISSASILIRMTPADPVAITFWRLAFATFIVYLFGVFRGLRLPTGRALVYSALSGVLLALHFLSWIPSLFFTTVAASTTLVNIHPVLMLVLAKFLKERIGRFTATGVILATGGSLVVTISPGGTFGDLLAVAGAVFFAGYLAVGRLVRSTTGTLSYVLVAYGVASAVSLATGLVLGSNLVFYDPYVFFMFLLIASIPMMLGHTIFNYLLGRYRAVTIAASTLGEPIGAAILAYLVLGEVPTGYVDFYTPIGHVYLPLEAFGIVVTLLGISMVIREEVKSR